MSTEVIKDLEKAAKLGIQKLNEYYEGLDFEWKWSDDHQSIKISSDVTLRGHDDDVLINITCYDSGATFFDLTFDKLAKTLFAFNLINDFNSQQYAFRGFINENNYLTLDSFRFANSEEEFADLCLDFMYFTSNLSENETLQQLTLITK